MLKKAELKYFSAMIQGTSLVDKHPKNLRIKFNNYVPDVKERIMEIIFNWGQEQPWDEKRVAEAELLLGFVEHNLLLSDHCWAFVNPEWVEALRGPKGMSGMPAWDAPQGSSNNGETVYVPYDVGSKLFDYQEKLRQAQLQATKKI